MKKINFSKLNGQGNDFILICAIKENYDFTKEDIYQMCDRHFGIGADGVILVKDSLKADFFMDYYNSDGTPAEMCGNGIRCMARYIYDKKLIEKNIFKIDTRAGIKTIELNIKNDEVDAIEVDMGHPIFNADKVPVNTKLINNIDKSFFNKKILQNVFNVSNYEKDSNVVFNYMIEAGGRYFSVNCVSMGNPHCIVFLNEDEKLEDFDLNYYGPKLENHSFFPNKTNVEFVKVNSLNEISMIVWERGCGETLACGTGACACAVASSVLEKVKSKDIKVSLKGGELLICWEGSEDDPVILKGSVKYNFEGEIII